MTFKEFMASANGRKLAPLFADPGVVTRMEAMSRAGQPALKAIDCDIALAVGTLDNVEKQHVGRWVRDILGRRGLRTVRQIDWRGGKVFSSGTVYAPIAPNLAVFDPPRTARSPVEQARATLAAGRTDVTRTIDTVDQFLADRRSNWREA